MLPVLWAHQSILTMVWVGFLPPKKAQTNEISHQVKTWVSDKFLTCPSGKFVSQKIEEATREIATVDVILTNMDKYACEANVTCNWRENVYIVLSLWWPKSSKLDIDFRNSYFRYNTVIFLYDSRCLVTLKNLKIVTHQKLKYAI
jgi:hypothetical protein